MPYSEQFGLGTPLPKRPGTTTMTQYSCGHVLVQTTNPVIFDPAGVLCETQLNETSTETCGHCDRIEAGRVKDGYGTDSI